jgi:hypothetical protein
MVFGMKKIFLVLACVVAMIAEQSCSNKNKIANTEIDEVQLDFTQMETDASIGYPLELFNQNDTLYLNDAHGDTIVTRINALNGRTIDKFATVGNGPGEVLRPIDLRPTHDSIYVLSRPNQALFSANKSTSVSLKKRVQMPGTISRLFFLNDGNAIVSVMSFAGTPDEFKNARYILFDKNMRLKYAFGSFPKLTDKEQSLNSEALSFLHQTDCVVCPDSDTFIALTQYGMSVYSKSKSGKYELKFDKALIKYDFTVLAGNDYVSTGVQTVPEESEGGIVHATMFGGNILLAQFIDSSSDNMNVYFRIINQNGETVKIMRPTIDVMAPFVLTSRNEIIAFHEDESGVYMIKSAPIASM